MNKRKSAPWLQALHAVMPLCISYIPVGLACGVLLQKLDLILSYQDCYRFWSFPVARSF